MNTATPLGYVLRGYANHHVLYPLATTVANGVVFTACEGDKRSQPVVGDSSGFALLIVIRVDSGSHHKLTTGGPAVGGTA